MATMLEVRVAGRVVTAEVVQENVRTCWVKLPDGNIVKRKAGRDYAVLPHVGGGRC